MQIVKSPGLFKDLLLNRYEDLVSDPLPQLFRMLEFLRQPRPSEAVLACIAGKLDGKFKREHK